MASAPIKPDGPEVPSDGDGETQSSLAGDVSDPGEHSEGPAHEEDRQQEGKG